MMSHNLCFGETNCLTIHDDGVFDIRIGDVSIVNCFPGVDGSKISPAEVQIETDSSELIVHYTCDDFRLILDWVAMRENLTLNITLDDLRRDAVEKLSVIQDAFVTGAEKLLAHGYFSWDQSFLIEASDLDSAEGNGVTAILGEGNVALAGYLNHDELFQTFNYYSDRNQIRFTTESYLEGKVLKGESRFRFPGLVFFGHKDLDEAQKQWADLVVKKNGMKPVKPTTKGWCSWYYDYFWFSGDILESHLENFAPHKDDLNLDVFVIDANHFEHLGDWLTPDPKFHKGLEYYATKIEKAGYVPGVWIGPWMVADRSRLYSGAP